MSVFQLRRFSQLQVAGVDCARLLQGQITADVDAVIGKAHFFALCNPKGMMLANGIIVGVHAHDFRLIVDQSLVAVVEETLNKFAPFYQVSLTRPEETIASSAKPQYRFDWPQGGIDIVENATIDQVAEQAWYKYMLESGVVFIHQGQSSRFLPADIGWDGFAVSFSKGCYTGQEIIARVHYRGTLKQDLFLADCAAINDSTIADDNGNAVGEVLQLADGAVAARIRKDAISSAMIDGVLPQWRLARDNYPQ